MAEAASRVRSVMPKKTKKQIRALAIEGLELAANNFVEGETDSTNLCRWLDDGTPESDLAWQAWQICPGGREDGNSRFGPPMLAEAALLLRDGWSPGDPVETFP